MNSASTPSTANQLQIDLRDPNILVSVIIPTYNKAVYLAESVLSAVNQSHSNIEIVIVNDGSTDNSLQVAQQLATSHMQRKFLILDKPNGGISDARNYAIARCQAPIVCCLDGDDLAEPTFIEKGLCAMRAHSANLVCCDVQIFGAEESEWVPQPYETYAERYNNNIPTLVMYEKKLWEKVGGYSVVFPFNEDWEFFLRLSRLNVSVHKIPEKLFKYRVTQDGLAQNYIKDSWEQSVGLMITSNQDMYPVEHVLAAHKNLSNMRSEWLERFLRQWKSYPNEWLLPFWIALALEGKNQLQEALDHYIQANKLASGSSWQILYRIASLIEKENKQQTAQLLHAVRILRPDMNRYAEEHLKRL